MPQGGCSVRSILSYVGGKAKIAEWIISHFPAEYHNLHYCEPFAGGLSVFFAKKPSKIETINDTDNLLINLWRVMQDEGLMLQLKDRLDSFIWSEKLWHEASDFLKQPMPDLSDKTKLDYAQQYLQKHFTAFSGTKSSFGFFKQADKRITTEYRKIGLFKGTNARFRNAQILNRKAEEVIPMVDGEETFFYADPPYPDTDQKSYSYKYTIDDLKALVALLRSCKGKWLLSCYEKNLEQIDTKDLIIHKTKKRVDFNFGDRVNRVCDEVLIQNFMAGQTSFFNQPTKGG